VVHRIEQIFRAKGEKMSLTENWLAALQADGCRITTSRRAVAEIVSASPRALTPQEVYEQARLLDPALGLVTVYRTLEKLEHLGLAERVHQPGGCNAYLAATHGHQHLLLCQNCGQVAYFEGDDLETLIQTIARRTGYQIREHWLQLFGLCANCQ
jgi:Fur family transcriptional regulator, ferric uptake regulator